jgi:hypothetical protein
MRSWFLDESHLIRPQFYEYRTEFLKIYPLHLKPVYPVTVRFIPVKGIVLSLEN